ncbi:hypothetical protein QO010_003833 [Caulobacter ginsengisoli]|uniref:Tetratricopeptide repeat protein n=1 Tax=Caulobacter ginsengisoli TaxID=400775 RepID=A0ABU0IVK7_9CAUL|nr:hypothetical protein [Caulobacter ginsengisoli]MDQ0466040.1 hypothetical protein [Caulobacter ginsengisoli]
MIPGFGLVLLFSIAMCVHVVRTHQQMYWLFIILVAAPPIGGIVYFVAIVLPELMGGSTARRLGQAARDRLDPDREYRQARAMVDDSPTVGNRMRLAAAAASLGRHAEAEEMYREAAQGIHAEDPSLLLGRAKALLELNRAEEALPVLEKLGGLGEAGRTPQAALAMGRAYQALGRNAEADTALQWAAGRLPGLEGIARYAVFLAQTGRKAEAQEALVEIDKRCAKATAHFRKEARAWRDFAVAGMAGA